MTQLFSTLSDRVNFLIECSRTSREEMLFRIKHRDQWLKTQLYIQAVLFAIGNGVKIAGTVDTDPNPDVLAISLPIAATLTVLYMVEDHLIQGLSDYAAKLSEVEQTITNGTIPIISWDASVQLRCYKDEKWHGLSIRFIAQLIAFVIIPSFLFYIYCANGDKWSSPSTIIILDLEIFSFIIIIWLLIKGFKFRKK